MNALKINEEEIVQEVEDMEEELMLLIEADDFDDIGCRHVQMHRHLQRVEELAGKFNTYESNIQLAMAEGFYRIANKVLKQAVDRANRDAALEACEVRI